MSEINYLSQIRYTGPSCLDSKLKPVNLYSDLAKIPRAQRYIGMEIVVLNDENNENRQTKYWLVGGTSNNNWVLKTNQIEVTGDDI